MSWIMDYLLFPHFFKKKLQNSSLIRWEFHIMHPKPVHLPVSQYPSLIPAAPPKGKSKIKPKRNTPSKQTKTRVKQNRRRQASRFAPPSSPPLQPLSLHPQRHWGRCVTQHTLHAAHPFVQTALPANVPCRESLVWFRASDFWYTIVTGSSPDLLWDSLWVPFHQTRPFPELPVSLSLRDQ